MTDELVIDQTRALAEPDWLRELLDAAIPPGKVVLLTAEHEADGGCCRTQPASQILGIGPGHLRPVTA